MQEEFGEGIVPFEYHVSGVFATEETEARAAWYGVTGVPVVRIDGKYAIDGASSCDQTSSDYRARIRQRLDETGGMSPVEVTGGFVPLMDEIRMTATFRLLDPASLSDLHALLILYEDEILCNDKHWQHVVRKVVDEPVVLSSVGDSATVARVIPVEEGWDETQIHAVAFLQEGSGDRQVIQGARLPHGDFDIEIDRRIASVPEGNGEALFGGILTNLGAATDTLSLSIDSGSFGGWSASLEGSADRILRPGEGSAVHLRVGTDAAHAIRSGILRAASRASGRASAVRLEVFNGSRSHLLVDDDGGRADEASIAAALESNALLADVWDSYNAHGQDSPLFEEMRDYEVVIWQTGFDLATYVLDRFDRSALARYIDAGGALCLSSQGFLNGVSEPDSFIRDRLGVESWALDTVYDHLDGISGDPIGDSLSCDLEFGFPYQNRGDDARPTSSAVASFVTPDGSHPLIRNTTVGGGRVVFMPAALHAVNATDPDPNNLRTLVGRIVQWLVRMSPAGVGSDGGYPPESAHRAAIRIRPNPSRGVTEIALDFPRGGPARLEVFDAAGRRIARLVDGSLPAGHHSWRWRRSSPGIYLLRLWTPAESTTAKIIVID